MCLGFLTAFYKFTDPLTHRFKLSLQPIVREAKKGLGPVI